MPTYCPTKIKNEFRTLTAVRVLFLGLWLPTIKYNNELIRLKTKGITLNIKLKKLLTKIKEIIDIKIKNDIMYLINYSNGGYLWIKVNLCY